MVSSLGPKEILVKGLEASRINAQRHLQTSISQGGLQNTFLVLKQVLGLSFTGH